MQGWKDGRMQGWKDGRINRMQKERETKKTRKVWIIKAQPRCAPKLIAYFAANKLHATKRYGIGRVRRVPQITVLRRVFPDIANSLRRHVKAHRTLEKRQKYVLYVILAFYIQHS